MTRISRIAVATIALALGAARLEAQAPDGAALYTRSCASCHGATGVPSATMLRTMSTLPDLSNPSTLASKPDSVIANVITNGKGAMRAPRTPYTPEQVRALVAYVRTLSRRP